MRNPSMNAEGRPVLLIACFDRVPDAWVTALSPAAPAVELRVWPDQGAADEVDYVVTWGQPRGFFARFPRLKAIFWTGAGVDGLLLDPDLPDVPITRMVDDSLRRGMVEFVTERVLHYHRLMPQYAAQQRAREWRVLMPPLARDRTVGVLGLGELGGACAQALAGLGFKVRGWSRSPRMLPGVDARTGPIADFLPGCEIIACVLPLTPQTRGILNRETFARLDGAWLINAGRGGHLEEEDLIPALDEGRLAGASLDVFRTEPLPPEHLFWGDPRIVVTPHAAALTHPSTAGPKILENLRRAVAGEPLNELVDRARGY